MNRATYKLLNQLLEGRYFGVCVDLGCGEGYYGPLLKKHCHFLIGVDHNISRLSVAKEFSGYNQVVFTDLREYNFPPDTEAAFMIEVLEHIPKADGEKLLNKMASIPFVALSTPAVFHKFSLRDHHQSLWNENDLQKFNLETEEFIYAFPSLPLYYKGIFAYRNI